MTQIDLSAPQDNAKLATIAALGGTEHYAPARSLRAKAIGGSVWTLAGHGLSQVLRLGGNLILTRLLFPEVFGLLALVQVVMHGLQMFSDVGINTSVIRDKRGDDPAFLNTAWTIQVIRGVGLCLCACILAWPAAMFYGQPDLVWLIPATGLGSIIMGFGSTALLTLRRHVRLRPLVLCELTSQLVGLAVMIGWALLWPSVWALVVGGLIRTGLNSLLSYFLLPGQIPRFTWDRMAAREMFRFGRWIFLSTALTFLLQQGDKAVLGKVITSAELGVFAIAAFLSRAPLEALLKLNARVLFPIYANVANNTPAQLRERLLQARMVLLALFLPVLWALAIGGRQIVGFLYDPRYAEAGWMLQILAVGVVGSVIATSNGSVLLAVGDSFRYMLVQVTRAAFLVSAMAIGGWLGGLHGFLVGIAASKFLDYPVLAWAIRRYGVWLPKLDLAAYLASAAVVTAALCLA